jgi:uncharacterized protein with PIN domain
MSRLVLRCYEELNDFLAPQRRKRDFFVDFTPPVPVRHLIETLGIPHTEVELILANGRSVDLGYRPEDGDRISLYPVFETLDITPLLRLREAPLRRIRFVADAHLGKLARWLRLMGFDTLFRGDWADQDLVAVAARERRILLTRDRALLMHRAVTHGCYIRSQPLAAQLEYLAERLDLCRAIRPFTRCMSCNGELAEISLAQIEAQVPPAVRRIQRRFWRCSVCGRPYWRGSHYHRLAAEVERLCGSRTCEDPVESGSLGGN